jgi:hypothetical protein
LVPGQFGEIDLDGPHRVDHDEPPTVRDRLARALSNAYSMAPGRLSLTKQDYIAADDAMKIMREHG